LAHSAAFTFVMPARANMMISFAAQYGAFCRKVVLAFVETPAQLLLLLLLLLAAPESTQHARPALARGASMLNVTG
jgi:hypothetical protein